MASSSLVASSMAGATGVVGTADEFAAVVVVAGAMSCALAGMAAQKAKRRESEKCHRGEISDREDWGEGRSI